MIPICLITGFLGSGKTTFLKNHIRKTNGRRFVYVVNDFASADVDGALIDGLGADVVSVCGGSIFCRCLVTDFIKTLKSVHDKFPDIEGVVIEASGIASPGVTSTLLSETKLDKVFELRSIIGVIDPGSVLKLLETLPNIEQQIQASDILLINKTDAYDENAIQAVEKELRQINAKAKLIRTRYSEADIDIFHPNDHQDLTGDYAKCKDPHYDTFSIQPKSSLSRRSIEETLNQFKDSIYRLKGFILIRGSAYYIDVSGGMISIAKHDGELAADQFQLALITPAGATEISDAIIAFFE